MNLCFATNNKHKLEELQALVGGKFQLQSLSDIGCKEELAEDQDTLEGNSLQKAEYVFEKYGVPCFADDSGLEVETLGGAPGVYSARYAGPQRSHDDNITLLIRNLEGKTNRNAQFRTVITLIDTQGRHQFEGVLKGAILATRKGNGGFGYDPVFQPEGFSKTLAEMSMEEKNKISHRGLAVKKFIEFLGRD